MELFGLTLRIILSFFFLSLSRLANEALKTAKQASESIDFLWFIDYLVCRVGVDAYEASLELGADGVKKSRKLGEINSFFLLISFNISFSIAEQTVELGRDKGMSPSLLLSVNCLTLISIDFS